MRYEDASHTGAFQGSQPIANDDLDSLPAGSRTPATGNLISGEGTQTGSAGADIAAGAHVAAIAGKSGEDTSFSGGKLSVSGEFGKLSVDADGNYIYQANAGVENVRDRFTYTLADNQGATDTGSLIVEIGKTPVVIKANAQQIVPGPDGVVTLPPGVELSDIRVVGRNLVIDMPDGTQLIIVDGAIFVPQLVLGGVEVPATNLAALLIGQEPQPAAGEAPQSSGGNFDVPVPPLDPGVPLGDLIPPTEYTYTPPEPEEVLDIIDREPEVTIQPDGQPATVNAVDTVDEAGLPGRNEGEPEGSGEEAAAGDNGDPSEATSGVIHISSPDGVDTVTINGIVITGVGQMIAGEFGTLVITSVSDSAIGYSYVLGDNTSGNATHDDFSVVLTDDDGDQAGATLTIDIIDDVPTARPDTDSIAAGEFGPATGNVITDAAAGDAGDGDSNAADTVGADDATLTSVSGAGGSDSTFGEGGLLVVNGQYGVLTIDAAGNYSYVRNPGTPGGVTDVFNYTLTDGDGDTSTSTLTIDIGNRELSLGNISIIIDDDALPGGLAGGIGDDPDAVNAVGTFATGAIGGDGPLTFSVQLTGAPAGFAFVSGGPGVVLLQQDGTTVRTITYDAATGSYEVTQNAPLMHPPGGEENDLVFVLTVTVTDQDGDTASGSITITVDDDTPVVTVELNREGAVTVDESGPTGASTIEFTGNEGDDENVAGSGPIGRAVGATAIVDANAQFGADGPSGSGLVYSLQLGGSDTALTLTDGSAIELQLIDGVIVGMVTEGAHAGEAAFAIAIDPATGVATVELYLSLDHPDVTNPNDSLPLGPDTIDVVVTATDSDGDSVDSDPVDVSGLFNFLDDAPSVDPALNADATVTVDESLPSTVPAIDTGAIVKGDDPDLAGGQALGSGTSGTAVVSANAAFGADGPAVPDGISYALSITNAASGVTLTDGTAINLVMQGGVIVGVVAAGAFAGQAAFAIAIDPSSGVVTVEQYLSLDHPVNPDPNDPLGLGDNTVAVTVTGTDGDGDPVTSGDVDISGQITFLDDGPSIDPAVNAQATVEVDESLPSTVPAIDTGAIVKGDDPDLAGGQALGQANSGVAIVDANAVFGADGPAAGGGIRYALSITNAASGVTLTDGSAINLQLVDGVIVGVVASGAFAGQAAFAIAIDPATGVVSVEQYLSLDHPVNPDPDDVLGLGNNTVAVTVTATDGDGDSVNSGAIDISGQISFRDDGPSADPVLDREAVIQVDESLPSSAAVIDTLAVVKGDDPDLAGGLAIGSGNSGIAMVDVNAIFGADGPAAGGGVSYEFSIINAASGVTLTDGSAINLQLLANGVVVGVVASGAFAGQAAFALAIDPSTGVVSLEQYLSLDHPVNPDPNDPLGLGDDTLGVAATVTDGDGDSITTDAVDISDQITFFDDGPSASNEPLQNVAEGATVTGQFDFVGGADSGSVTHINGTPLVFGPGGFSQWIAVDDGQIRAQADGSYEFEADASGSGVTNGTFTVTDGDGDPVTADWSFNIEDVNFPTAGTSDARLDDDGLTGGNPASVVGDIDANVGELAPANPEEDIFHGQLNLSFGGDGPGAVSFASMDGDAGVVGTENVIYHWNGSNTLTAEIDGGPRDGGTLFTLVVNPTTGEYTLTLNDNVIHAAGGNETSAPNVPLSFTVTDSDGSFANGTLNIEFNDDAPTLSNVLAASGVTLDETSAGTPAGFPINNTSAAAVITATQAFGADGAAAANSVAYGLAVAGGSPQPSGLATAIGDHPITLVAIDGDTIQGQYQDGGTQVAFTIQMNANGTVTLTENVPLEHLVDGSSAAAHDDALNLSGLVNATITITDGDGDTATGSAGIGANLVFRDDGPDAQVNGQAALDTLVLDESRPEGTDTPGGVAPTGDASATANFADNFAAVTDFGADGPGTVSYSLVLSGNGIASGLFALQPSDIINGGDGDGYGQGAAITLSVNAAGTLITGSAGGTDYFTISINPGTGVVTFTQLNPIWHPTPGSSFDEAALLNTAAASNVQVVQTVTDADGDFDTAGINVGQGVFSIQDDGPQAIQPDSATLENEAGATVTADLDDDGEVITDFGEDGAGLVQFANIANGDDSGFTSDGDAIEYFLSNNGQTLQGRTNSTNGVDGELVFTVQINQAGGDYTVTMAGTVDNGAGVSFNDLTSSAAGNVSFRGVGEDDAATTVDLLLSAGPGAATTVNTDSDSIGANNQSMDDGELVRIDFVTNLTTDTGDPDTPPTGFNYGAHVSTNSFLGLIPQVQGSQSATVAFTVWAIDSANTDATAPDRNSAGGFSDGSITTITDVTVQDYLTSATTTVDVTGFTVGVFTAVAYGISVRVNADGSVSFSGIQQGDHYGFTTDGGDFNAVAVQGLPTGTGGASTNSFDLGIFSIGQVDTGEPVDLSFDLNITDADGDTVTMPDAINVTLNPAADSLAATNFSSLSSESQSQQLQKTAANSNTLTLAAAVAAAGVVETQAAAAPLQDHGGSRHHASDLASDSGARHTAVAVDDHRDARSALSNETREAANDSAPAASPGHRPAPAESDHALDNSQAHAEAQSSVPTANDQGPAQVSANASPVAPTVAMVSAEALKAAGVEGNAQHGDSVEQVVAEALGHGNASATVDALLNALPGGNGAVGALANVASPGAEAVPAWNMSMHGAFAAGHDMMMNVHVAMHHDAVQPVANG